MRITNLHLIFSFFLLSAGAFFGYRFLRTMPSPGSFPFSISSPAPAAELDSSDVPPLDTAVEFARDSAKQSLEKAMDFIGEATAEGRDVMAQFSAYRRARDLFDSAQTAEEFEQVRAQAEELTSVSPPAPQKLKIYVVRRGDNLWNIAKKKEVFGRGSAWVKIWRANEAKVSDFDILVAGQKLAIPD